MDRSETAEEAEGVYQHEHLLQKFLYQHTESIKENKKLHKFMSFAHIYTYLYMLA